MHQQNNQIPTNPDYEDDDPEIEDQGDVDYINTSNNNKPYGSSSSNNGVEAAGFFNDSLYRQLSWSAVLFFFSLLALGRMFSFISAPDCGYAEWEDEYKTIIIGYIFCGIGIVCIFIGSLIGFILSLLKKQLLGIVLFIILLIGSILYIIGSWIVIGELSWIYCMVGASNQYLIGHSIIIFGEFAFIAFMSILLGLDFWKDSILNDFRLRMILYCSLTLFSSLIIFLGYAVLGNYLSKESQDGSSTYVLDQRTNERVEEYNGHSSGSLGVLAGDMEYTAFAWFCMFITMVIYLIALLCIRKTIVYGICAIAILISTVLTAIGYWALNQYGSHAMNAYYVGMSFFLIGVGIIFSLDMILGSFLKKIIKR